MIEAASEIIEATVLRDTLLSLSQIQALTEWQGQHKVFYAHVDKTVPLPYIVLTHYLGGDEKDGRYSDSTWMIVAHTADKETADTFSNAISELVGKTPNTAAYENVCAYTPLKKKGPYFQRTSTQNNIVFRSGGIFRIQLYLGEIY